MREIVKDLIQNILDTLDRYEEEGYGEGIEFQKDFLMGASQMALELQIIDYHEWSVLNQEYKNID